MYLFARIPSHYFHFFLLKSQTPTLPSYLVQHHNYRALSGMSLLNDMSRAHFTTPVQVEMLPGGCLQSTLVIYTLFQHSPLTPCFDKYLSTLQLANKDLLSTFNNSDQQIWGTCDVLDTLRCYR